MEQHRFEVVMQRIWVMCNTVDAFILAVETFVFFFIKYLILESMAINVHFV
jgi:hypothetical protein